MATQQEMQELAAEMTEKCGFKLPAKVAVFVGDLSPFDAVQLVLDVTQRDQPVDILCPYKTAPEVAHVLLDRGREFVTLPFIFALFGDPTDALLPCDRMAIEHALRDTVSLVFAAHSPTHYAEGDSAMLWVKPLIARARTEGAALVLAAAGDSAAETAWEAAMRKSGANDLHPSASCSTVPGGWCAVAETHASGAPRSATRATAVDAELSRGAAILERSLSDSREALSGVMHSAGDLVAFFVEINLIARGEMSAQLSQNFGPWDFRERVLSATGGIPISHAQLIRHADFIALLHVGTPQNLRHYALQLHSVWVDFQPMTARDPLGPHKLYFYLAPAPREPSDLLSALLDLCTHDRAGAPLDTGALITALVDNYRPTREHYIALCAWSRGPVANGCFAFQHAACDHDRSECYCGMRAPEVWCVEALLTAVAGSCDAAQAARHLHTSSLFELLSPRAVQFIGADSVQELADLREMLARSQLGRSLCTTATPESGESSAEASSSSSSEFAIEMGKSRVLCHPERVSAGRRLAHITSGEVVIYIGSRVSSHRELATLYESGGIRILYQDPSAGCVVQLAPLAAPGHTPEARVDEAVARLIHDFVDLRHTLQGGGVWLGRPRPDPDAFERLLARTAAVPGTHPTAAMRAFLRPSPEAALAFKLLFSKARVLHALDAETSTLAPPDWLDLLRLDLLRIYVPGRLATAAMRETLLKLRTRILREERADWTTAITTWLGDSDSGSELCEHLHQDLGELSRTLATEEEEEKRTEQAPPSPSSSSSSSSSSSDPEPDLLAALWVPQHLTDDPRQLRADLACLIAEPELLAMVPYVPYARDTLVGAWRELETARGPLRERYAALASANLHSDNVQRYRALFSTV